ncbi:uncharacterized protein LOC109542699 [Dendroctonus ponderosae]
MNSSKNLFRLTQVVVSATRNASKEVVNPRFHTMKARQKVFGVDDGVPVHLKAGFGDKMLVSLTWVLIGVGLAGSGHTVFTLITK